MRSAVKVFFVTRKLSIPTTTKMDIPKIIAQLFIAVIHLSVASNTFDYTLYTRLFQVFDA